MAKQILFIHGGAAYQEDRALVDNLREVLGSGYTIRYPKMPQEDSPEYLQWREQITKELASLGAALILVGHSLGASVLLKYLSEEEVGYPIRGAFLLAPPYWGAESWQVDEYTLKNDFAAYLPEAMPLFFYHSRGDTIVPFSHIGFYQDALPQATFHELEKDDAHGGHQFGNDLAEVAEAIETLTRG